jgi:hypothetical protein
MKHTIYMQKARYNGKRPLSRKLSIVAANLSAALEIARKQLPLWEVSMAWYDWPQ